MSSKDIKARDVDALASAYAAEYAMTTEGNDYVPTDWERTLIEDALHGFIAEHRLTTPTSPSAAPDERMLASDDGKA